jgi:anti-sigma-K factor RskA
MSTKLNRYQSPEIIDHLAANYVLGTLSTRVNARLNKLRLQIEFTELDKRIQFWEQKMSPLNEKTAEIAPKVETWQQIQAKLNHSVTQAPQKTPWYHFFNLRFYQVATACSLLLIALLSFQSIQLDEPNPGSLSYVAVLADAKQSPQVVAATYGESQTLLLDILTLPHINEDETLELWVTSKTDKQARSLGEIPTNVASFTRQLSDAEWRLIKDSDSLLITVEEAGGSPIGEPLGEIISSGACIRLSAWQEQV